MHTNHLAEWQHDHSFGQDQKRPGETRTLIVVIITAVMMVAELIAGGLFGSMALLADGLHMGSHSVALMISVFAYWYARRHANNREYSFGTGKVNALGGFTGAVLLAGFAFVMAFESVLRLLNPVEILFNQALIVAIIGLLVNGICVFILGVDDHHHDHGHGHDHDHGDAHDQQHHDHNLKSAYLHVLADALTSVLAIIALLAAKFYAANWIDPVIGILGAVLVGKWSIGLLKSTSATLLDRQAPEKARKQIIDAIENDQDSKVTDLHIWSIGPGIYSAIISLVAHQPKKAADYKALIPHQLGVAHAAIEITLCEESLD